jgi:hypothetical protein
MDENKPPKEELHGIELTRRTQREYYAENKEQFREYKKKYAEKLGPEEVKRRDHEKYLRRRDKAIQHERQKRAKDDPSILDRRERLQFFKENPGSAETFHRQCKFITWRKLQEIWPRLLQGPCEICGKIGERMDADHCHSGKQFRGVLCRSCNMTLGHIKDSPEWLRSAAAYLERSIRLAVNGALVETNAD